MGRLTAIGSRFQKMTPRLAPVAVGRDSAERRKVAPWRAWYSTARWQRLRWSVLVRDLFTCAMCGRAEAQSAMLVADHKVPHRGNEALFWDAANLQCLCKPCHDKDKQRAEQGGVGQSLALPKP